jgi:cobalt-precorrin 5A hydrolase/precorrin-3B C17-methyltransferase
MAQVAIVVLGQHSVALARRLMAALPEATLYGLANRTTDVDVHFTHFGDTLRNLFTSGTAIIGICAAGILIRTLAPLLTDKRYEPPVLAIAEDGSAVVPLLGGLQGVNDLARHLGEVLQVAPAITTTGDIRFRTALLSPPAGYRLANHPDHAKTFIADVLAGASVRLDGVARWLQESQLPIAPHGTLTIQVTERPVTPMPDCLVYHPTTVAIGVCRQPERQAEGEQERQGASHVVDAALNELQHILAQADIAPAAVAGLFALDSAAGDPVLHAIAESCKVPARFFTPADLEPVLSQHAVPAGPCPALHTASALALAAVGQQGWLTPSPSSPHATSYAYAIARSPLPIDPAVLGRGRGWLAVVGTGPGGGHWMSPEVKDVLQAASDWVGYATYLDLAEPLRKGQQRHASDNRVELDRAHLALDLAAEGRAVALVSSGDPGIYAMAAAVFEVLERENKPAWQRIEIQVCPGISAMQAAAAQAGAPLGHDFCAISLSDILKPWTIIAQRLAAAAQADFVLALYNPGSQQRTWQLQQARKILLQWRPPHTPVILARNLGRPGQAVTVKPLDQLNTTDADMRTIIIVGSSQTRLVQRGDGRSWVYTPRHYTAGAAAQLSC